MRIWIIDAFASRPFAGNPAAVCVLDRESWPDDRWMRDLAAELNLPMTAFALPLADDPDADWGLRWFNAVMEEQLCGHATLATVHALHAEDRIGGKVRFKTASGVLPATVGPEDRITLDFPAAQLSEIPVADALAEALGVMPQVTYATAPLGDVLALLSDEDAVRAVAPDMAALDRFTTAGGVRGVIVTAKAEPTTDGYDFVSRFFSPANGLPEDPVTGSAHTALGPYWASRLGRDELVGLQASARTGVVHTAVRGDRVLVSGHTATVLQGVLAGDLAESLPGD